MSSSMRALRRASSRAEIASESLRRLVLSIAGGRGGGGGGGPAGPLRRDLISAGMVGEGARADRRTDGAFWAR